MTENRTSEYGSRGARRYDDAPMDLPGESGISVVLATRDRPELLHAALEALGRSMRPEDELIVVDSASADPAVSRVLEKAGVHTIRLDRPGTSLARNAGVAAARSPIVAFVDDDCIVAPEWLERIEAAFSYPGLGFVTGRVDADRQASLATSVFVGAEIRRFDGPADPAAFGGAGNSAFRREALLQIGGFDEGMGPATPLCSAEDQDVFWRMVRAGWRGIYDPSIVVTHTQWRGRSQTFRREYEYGVGAGAVAIKLIRLRDAQGWPVMRARLWHDGFGAAVRSLRSGYKSGVVGGLMRATGVCAGAFRAARTPLVDGLYTTRSSSHVR